MKTGKTFFNTTLIFLLAVFCASLFAAAQDPYEKAKTYQTKGYIQVRADGTEEWKKLKPNSMLKAADELKVAEGASVKLLFSNNRILSVQGPRTFHLKELVASMLVKERRNTLLRKFGKADEQSFAGATAVAGVRGSKADPDQAEEKTAADNSVTWETKPGK